MENQSGPEQLSKKRKFYVLNVHVDLTVKYTSNIYIYHIHMAHKIC